MERFDRHRKVSSGRLRQFVAGILASLPEPAFHLGVSSAGVVPEGTVRQDAVFLGKSKASSGRSHLTTEQLFISGLTPANPMGGMFSFVFPRE